MRRSFLFKLVSFLPFSLLLTMGQLHAAPVDVSGAYVRSVPPGHPNSAAFMVLKNTSDQDRALVNAKSSISKVVELHTHRKEGGMMRMRRIKQIDIKAGGETVLKPGGLHVMFIGLKQAVNPGDEVDLELVFDDGSKIKLMVPVKVVAGMMKKMSKY